MADEGVPHTRGRTTTGSANDGARETWLPRRTAKRSPALHGGLLHLEPVGFYRQSRRGERVSLLEAHRIGNQPCGARSKAKKPDKFATWPHCATARPRASAAGRASESNTSRRSRRGGSSRPPFAAPFAEPSVAPSAGTPLYRSPEWPSGWPKKWPPDLPAKLPPDPPSSPPPDLPSKRPPDPPSARLPDLPFEWPPDLPVPLPPAGPPDRREPERPARPRLPPLFGPSTRAPAPAVTAGCSGATMEVGLSPFSTNRDLQ